MDLLTPQEWIVFLSVNAIAFGVLAFNAKKGALEIWQPSSLYSLLYLYYVTLGPFYLLLQGNTAFIGIELRPYFLLGWIAGGVSLIAFLSGYLISSLGRANSCETSISLLSLRQCRAIIVITFFMVLLSVAYVKSGFASNVLVGYIANLLNFSIPGILLSMLVWLKWGRTYDIVFFLLYFSILVPYYLSTGFRFRIVWLFLGLLSAYYIYRLVRPNFVFLTVVAVLFLGFMGFIGMNRDAWRDGDLTVSGGIQSSLDRGAAEAGTFLASCSVLEAIPSRVSHTYFDPLWVTITFPIPRSLWLNKPASKTLEAMAWSFGSLDASKAGQAVPFYMEWYIAFGWIGLITSSVLAGWACGRLWMWFVRRNNDIMAILIYTTTLGYSYFFFSRGYLPVATFSFVFGIFPFFILHRYLLRKQNQLGGKRRMRAARMGQNKLASMPYRSSPRGINQ